LAVQAEPSFAHPPSEQRPLMQLNPWQHCSPSAQDAPSSVQAVLLEQRPSVQLRPEQQSVASAQDAPPPPQEAIAVQRPSGHVNPEQQSVSTVQADSWMPQELEAEHAPSRHCRLEQQSEADEQKEPVSPQVAVEQTPPEQVSPEQQSVAMLQVSPSALQVPGQLDVSHAHDAAAQFPLFGPTSVPVSQAPSVEHHPQVSAAVHTSQFVFVAQGSVQPPQAP
jgi:hypothetical protein